MYSPTKKSSRTINVIFTLRGRNLRRTRGGGAGSAGGSWDSGGAGGAGDACGLLGWLRDLRLPLRLFLRVHRTHACTWATH